MRRTIPLLMACLLLSSCIPLEEWRLEEFGQSSASTPAASSSAANDFPVEIEETSSSSIMETGTGSIAQRVVERGILEIGLADAPHLLTVFTNYGCDYCEQFMRDMLPRVQRDFLLGGDLRMRLMIVPLKKYPNSLLEASALLCATAMEKGMAMHDAIRAARLRERKALIAIATKLDLPTKQFAACLGSKETKSLMNEQQSFITENGVTLIPTFVLNGERIVGLPSYPDLRGWIRENLAQ